MNGIDFSPERWARVKANAAAWWRGELGRPLVQMCIYGCDPGRPAPTVPRRHYTAGYGPDVTAEQIVDRWDYDLRGLRYVGDSFPHVFPNFGPGVVAEFMGCPATVQADETVWFHAPEGGVKLSAPIGLDERHPTLKRVADLMRAAQSRWQGLVQVGTTDLGGNLDVLSSFWPSEQLLLDLYDAPELVKARTWDAHRAWWRAFELLNQALQPTNPGYSSWAGIFSEGPGYILQCDFCYMIGTAMFDEFVKPELVASCAKLDNAFYHLDGKGQLPHLDSLLEIEALKGVQWVPGDGAPGMGEWPEVYQKIQAAGKKIHLYGGVDDNGDSVLDMLADQLGTAEDIVIVGGVPREREAELLRLLDRYGVDA